MEFLWTDPRTDLAVDSNRWHRFFRMFSQMEDRKKAEILHKRLWCIRRMGTLLQPQYSGYKRYILVPVIGQFWEDEAEFEEIKRKFLVPFTNEIVDLFERLEKSYEDEAANPRC